MLNPHALAESVVIVSRLWAPDGPEPEVVIHNEAWQPEGHVRVFYTGINSMLRRLMHGPASRIIVFVDQRVRKLEADGMLTMLTGEDTDWDGIVSPQIAVEGDTPEPWHEAISPYAWAARNFVLSTMRPAWEHHLQFGHEKVMADACHKAEIECVCNRRSTAWIEDEGPATAVTNALYYRQLEDAAAVAAQLGVEGPSV